MSISRHKVAESVITLINNERPAGAAYDAQMRDYLLKVIDIQKNNDPDPRAGCGYVHIKYRRSVEKLGSPEIGRADDYCEHV